MVIENVRVVVMGEPEPHRSEFVTVSAVTPIVMGPTQQWWNAWGWDTPITLPWHSREGYHAVSHFPPPGGVRVLVARFPAEDAYLDEQPRTEEQRAGHAKIIDMLTAVDVAMTSVGPNPAMHHTDTIDIGYVVEGEVDIEASDGHRERLRAGDIYVNNGAAHAWRSTASGATVFFVFLGAERKAQ